MKLLRKARVVALLRANLVLGRSARLTRARVGPQPDIRIEQGGSCRLGRGVVIGRRLTLRLKGDLTIGEYTFINNDAHIVSHSSLQIGKQVRIGERISIHDENHIFEPVPVNSSVRDLYETRPIQIGNRVWLGANVTVLGGVTIGDDAVVAAGSVVTGDIPAAHLAAGVPA